MVDFIAREELDARKRLEEKITVLIRSGEEVPFEDIKRLGQLGGDLTELKAKVAYQVNKEKVD